MRRTLLVVALAAATVGCTTSTGSAEPMRPAPARAMHAPAAPSPATCTTGNPATAAGWAAALGKTPLYGDGMISVPLDSRRCAFVTGDAVERVPGRPWAHSSITIVEGGRARVVAPGRYGSSPYQVTPDLPDGSFNWLGPAAAAGGRLYSLAPRVTPAAAWPYFEPVGVDLVWFRYGATGDPVYAGRAPIDSVDDSAGGKVADPVSWGAGLWIDGATAYVFGSRLTDGWTGYSLYAARVPVAQLGTLSAWRYLDVLGGWSSIRADAAPVLTTARDGGTESAVSLWRDGGGWHVTSRRGGRWGGAIVRWTAPVLSPRGGWTQRELVSAAKLAGVDPYVVTEHVAVPLADGTRALTWNTEWHDATWTAVPR